MFAIAEKRTFGGVKIAQSLVAQGFEPEDTEGMRFELTVELWNILYAQFLGTSSQNIFILLAGKITLSQIICLVNAKVE